MNEKSDIYVEGELLHIAVKKDNIVIPMSLIKEFEFLNAYLFAELGSIVIKELHYLDYHCQSQLIYRWVQKFGCFSNNIDSFLDTLEHVTNKTVRIIDKNYPAIP